MEQRPFGFTKREVAIIGQGTWYLEDSDPLTAIAALRQGLDLGMTHIDTAEMYGAGRAEELVGAAIAGRARRLGPAADARRGVGGRRPDTRRRGRQRRRWQRVPKLRATGAGKRRGLRCLRTADASRARSRASRDGAGPDQGGTVEGHARRRRAPSPGVVGWPGCAPSRPWAKSILPEGRTRAAG
jgi:hypothetical protein